MFDTENGIVYTIEEADPEQLSSTIEQESDASSASELSFAAEFFDWTGPEALVENAASRRRSESEQARVDRDPRHETPEHRANHHVTDSGEGTKPDSNGTDAHTALATHDRLKPLEKRVHAASATKHSSPEAKVDTVRQSESWAALALSPRMLRVVESLGWMQPTPIQAQAIPVALAGRDVLGSAVTGSGKTAAFLIPIIERLYRAQRADGVRFAADASQTAAIRVLIVLPTRELAVQCHAVLEAICDRTARESARRMKQGVAKFVGTPEQTRLRSVLLVGGLALKPQELALRHVPDIIIGTPGRIIDHARNAPNFTLDDVEILVLDEADRLLQMGFMDELREVVRLCAASAPYRQTMLFSATLDAGVEELARFALAPDRVVTVRVDATFDLVGTLVQEFVKLQMPEVLVEPAQDTRDTLTHAEQVVQTERAALLLALCSRSFTRRVIVFFARKRTAHLFKIIFDLVGLRAAELHGNLTQAQRLDALEAFRTCTNADFLLCTDLAARGLDIHGVETVLNYELPKDIREYVHRVGRTARAGKHGRAVSIFQQTDRKERHLLRRLREQARRYRVDALRGDAPVPAPVLLERRIPATVIREWRDRLHSLLDSVREKLRQEREHRELERAERLERKAHNLLIHEQEIYARPPRTWFQSKAERKRAQMVDQEPASKERSERSNSHKHDKVRKRKLVTATNRGAHNRSRM
ncbi:probable ATP dependent RNA helicase [Cyanidioschyzon merolae strain 10D]|uniref:Probable ATP dependent RNA helicase n=1 Tax=Cyanidioschyzon merolae (strain NIES-3377 / 10D) TaxID=280699 RepID=M1VJE8_CYAM1|nr:probable ATP dependent RNA helicase [Cyanidioschyzon merolae strain 10D]BAM81428.1 probable ATP dependent RNA helicase [Cyanidioschyzon merolae strain 10D]|eukprot:XP_005537464.1 probable ATP dependent RNA helicase [Cyanidioschyzon merolae strain 10D]